MNMIIEYRRLQYRQCSSNCKLWMRCSLFGLRLILSKIIKLNVHKNFKKIHLLSAPSIVWIYVGFQESTHPRILFGIFTKCIVQSMYPTMINCCSPTKSIAHVWWIVVKWPTCPTSCLRRFKFLVTYQFW